MASIRGTTAGREGVLASVSVEIKNENFETMYQTLSDESGNFELCVPDGVYPFLTAVRNYGDQYLEYWAQNIPAQQEPELHIRIDTLEVYGLHAFIVKGAANALSIYFRPMSLEKYKAGEVDIAPVLKGKRYYGCCKRPGEQSIRSESGAGVYWRREKVFIGLSDSNVHSGRY